MGMFMKQREDKPSEHAARRQHELDVLCELLVEFEGMHLKAYKCPAGVPTISAGCTRTLGNRRVQMGMEVTEEVAWKMLRRDAEKKYESVRRLLRATSSPGARIAFSSLAFNVGVSRVAKSDALRMYNARLLKSAEKHFKQFRLANGKVLKGLVARRNREWVLIARDES